jgi:LysR family transcriptional activator of nhaA
VELVGQVETIRERYYAVSVERRLRHPAVVVITEAARLRMFSDAPGLPGRE